MERREQTNGPRRHPPPRSPLAGLCPGDWDGFFALFFSGFPDLLLIAGLAPLCGFPPSMVATRILPAVAFSILGGNLFYAWQAHRLAERTGRNDVTAIPFGVNAPTIFAYIFLDHAAGLRTHTRFERGLASRGVRLLPQWRGADGGRVLHGLATASHAQGRAAVSAGGNRHGLSVLGFCLARLPGSGARAAARHRHTDDLFRAGSFAVPLARRTRLHRHGAILAAVLKLLHLYPLAEAPAYAAVGIHLPHPIHLLEFLRQGEGWKFLLDHPADESGRYDRFFAGTRKRASGRRRLPDHAIFAGERAGHDCRCCFWEPFSDGALFRPHGA